MSAPTDPPDPSQVVLFVHSTGTGPALWSRVPAHVVGSRNVRFPANIGYAPGDVVPRGVTVSPADDAARVLTSATNFPAVHLVAHSYGALVALHAAQQLGHRLASLFFFEPVVFGQLLHDPEVDDEARAQARSFRYHPWFLTDLERGGSDDWLEMFVDYWNRPGSWARMPTAQKEETRALGWKMFQEVRSCFLDDLSPAQLRLSVPTTIVRGEKTTVAAIAMAKLVARAIPSARFIELAGASHMAPLAQPDKVHPLLAQHFARLRS